MAKRRSSGGACGRCRAVESVDGFEAQQEAPAHTSHEPLETGKGAGFHKRPQAAIPQQGIRSTTNGRRAALSKGLWKPWTASKFRRGPPPTAPTGPRARAVERASRTRRSASAREGSGGNRPALALRSVGRRAIAA